MLTKEALAERLNGREYGNEITKAEEQEAKESGLLVFYGYSDDNIEINGAIDEEIGACDGTTILLADGKLLPDEEELREDDEVLKKYGILDAVKERYKSAVKIKAVWSAKGYSWFIHTKVPHATFEIMEDGEKFCRGIVIEVNPCA